MDKLKIIIGAAETIQKGWISTDINQLNVTIENDWKKILKEKLADNILSEHVWEHLTVKDADLANKNIFKFLKKGGIYRVAVPDGFHPDPDYIEYVKPGGSGSGAKDHKVLYNYQSLKKSLESCGFEIVLIEYWNEIGNFINIDWNDDDGRIERSSKYDERNKGGELKYTSLIIDAIKP